LECNKHFDILMKMVKLHSYPIGVRILKKDDPVPKDAAFSSKCGIKVDLCQWMTLARRWGWIVGVTGEEIMCTPCLAGFGFKKLQQKKDLAQAFFDMGYFESLELAVSHVEHIELLKPDTVKCIVMFPLDKAPIDPDIVIIYGTPAQMSLLATAFIHNKGRLIRTETSVGLTCLSAVLPFWKKEPTFVFPARGERVLSQTHDTEMLFSLPSSDLEFLSDGLIKIHKKGTRYPFPSYLLYQPPLIPPLQKLGEKLI
jgi:uncharacterized protein (DUF169 family)